ncbi:MAG: acyl-CoA desaturase, partial [Pseudomonadota bacterium]
MKRLLDAMRTWFDSGSAARPVADDGQAGTVDWVRVMPYIGMHLACLGVLWVGWSPVSVAVAIAAYAVRMVAITGFYH